MGNEDHPTFLPPHVCQIISGQMAKRKLDPTQSSDMIKSAIRRPEETRNSINVDAFRILGLNNNSTLVRSSYCDHVSVQEIVGG